MSIINLCKSFGRWGAVAGLFAALFLTGCASDSSEQFAEIPGVTGGSGGVGGTAGPGGNSPLLASSGENLHAGEPLLITFSDMPNAPPAAAVRIGEDGTITLVWNQTFIAAGKTRGELEREIRARYVPAIYHDATINVVQTERWYYVRGEVKSESRQPYPGQTTVLKAIASVGGFTDFAKKTKVKLIRTNGSKSTIDCIKAIDHPELDLPVNPGDIIFVPRRIF